MAALVFGFATAGLIHFAWYPAARMNGMIPALTMGVGLAHAVAAAFTGARLIDPARTRTSSHAALLGAGTSIFALAMFTPALAIYVSSSNVGDLSVLAFAALTFFTGFFAFLAAGWALLLLSVALAWGLYRIAAAAA